MAQPALHALDIARVAPKLYIGSAPPVGPTLSARGFDVVLLCAREYQPRSHELPGVLVVHCGINDAMVVTQPEIDTAFRAADMAAMRVMARRRVLVSCWQGKNRSGLMTALTLMRLYGISGDEAVETVQRARPGALFNPAFVQLLNKLG